MRANDAERCSPDHLRRCSAIGGRSPPRSMTASPGTVARDSQPRRMKSEPENRPLGARAASPLPAGRGRIQERDRRRARESLPLRSLSVEGPRFAGAVTGEKKSPDFARCRISRRERRANRQVEGPRLPVRCTFEPVALPRSSWSDQLTFLPIADRRESLDACRIAATPRGNERTAICRLLGEKCHPGPDQTADGEGACNSNGSQTHGGLRVGAV